MASLAQAVRIDGLDRLINKLRGREFIGQPITDVMHRAVDLVLRSAHHRAPHDMGNMESSLYKRMPSYQIIPRYAVISTEATSDKGYRYPFALEAGKGKVRRKIVTKRKGIQFYQNAGLRYRSGPFKGKSTKGWLRKSLNENRANITRMLDGAARQVEALFARL